MLKSKKSKIIIGAAGILAVLIVASICVTSIFKKTDVDEFDYSLLASAEDTASSTLTQIDYIIQEADPYKVLIIADSASDVESVKTFFESSDGFREYVINDNRTIADLMAENKVSVEVKTAASYAGKNKTEISTSLSDVDMIFLYGKDSSSFTGGNAISEDLYECLHNYMSANKPMIISYYQIKNGSQDVIITPSDSGYNSKVYNMTSVSFKNSWKRCNTTNISDWKITTATGDQEGQAQDVIKSYIMSPRSAYIRYYMSDVNIPAGYANWAEYWSRVNGESKLRILYIYGGDQDADGNEVTPAALGTKVTDIQAVGNWMIGDGASYTFNTEFKSNLPTGVEVNAVRASDLVVHSADDSVDTTNALYVKGVSGADVKQYDYIYIAPDTYHPNYDMSDDVVSAVQTLSSATDSMTYILFGTLKGKTTSKTTTTTGGDHDPFAFGIDTTTNYGKLVDLSVTTTAYAKKSNVLPVGTTFMSDVAAAPNNQPTKIAQIVTLINKSAYKTHAGSGSGAGSGSISTEAFRVLELQPCYPIDLELAAKSTIETTYLSSWTYANEVPVNGQYKFTNPLGNYYTIPANVVNTSEIDNYATLNDDQTAATMTQEYYDWDLSKAKVAYALGMNAEQIELVQMSTDEYITAKADVSDAYDLIYIGGNMSAFKNHNAYGGDANSNTVRSGEVIHLAVYSMYTHTGEPFEIRGEEAYYNKGQDSFMNGNDITYDRYLQLIAYIDAGMPIVFSNEIWNAYTSASSMSNKYKNRYIDPDSNMYHLCEYADAKGKQSSSVLRGWSNKQKSKLDPELFYTDYYVDADTMVIDNEKGTYGTSSYVTVYKSDSLNNELYDCVYSSNVRPKFSLKTTAITYVEGDSTTKLDNHTVSWEINLLNAIEGHSYQAFLIQDKNDNGVFEEDDEKLSGGADLVGGSATLTYTYPTNEFGAFSWKLMVRDTTNKATASTSSITVFNIAKKTEKMSASILEIMPMTQAKCNSDNPSAPDGHSFYLDKNYQQSSGNPFLFSSYGTAGWEEYGYCPSNQSMGTADDGQKAASDAFAFNSNYACGAYKNGNFNNGSAGGLNMGKYKAELSVNRYDSAAGHEDRDYNYMDLVSDMYDFNLDIMYMDDIDYYSKAARNSTAEQRADYLQKANEAYTEYISYETPGTANYNALNAVESSLRTALENIRNGSAEFDTPDGTAKINPADYNTYGIDKMLVSKDYFRFFYLNATGVDTPTSNEDKPAVKFYRHYYGPYIAVNNKRIEAYRTYRHFSMMAYGPDEYLRQNYDVIVIGFMDDYQGIYTDFSVDAANDLMTFTKKEDVQDAEGNVLPAGSLLMTHDNLTAINGEKRAKNLTNALRANAGMNGTLKLTAESGTENSNVPKYRAVDSNRYFLTSVATNGIYKISANGDYDEAVYNQVKTVLSNTFGTTSINLDDALVDLASTSYWPMVRDSLGIPNYESYESQKSTKIPTKDVDDSVVLEALGEIYQTQLNASMPALNQNWRTKTDPASYMYYDSEANVLSSNIGAEWINGHKNALHVSVSVTQIQNCATLQDVVDLVKAAMASSNLQSYNSFYTQLETKTGMTISESDRSSISTVEDMVNYLVNHSPVYSSIESGFGITIPVDVRDTLVTVYDLTNYVTDHRSGSTMSFDLSKNSTLTGADWNSAVSTWLSNVSRPNKHYYAMGFTDIYNIYRTGGYSQTVRYLYGEIEMQSAIVYNMQIGGPLRVSGTAKATQVNRGVVTSYPFYIASDLRISNTHGQTYALDLENQDVAVWYTLAGDNQSVAGQAGGTNYSLMKQNSSLFAASPKDGMDSYYIYSIGNIVYCGAGHSLITGYMRDNNDERRLFLNVLINMAKHSTLRPKETEDDEIIMYDPDGETKAPGNVVKENTADGYYINVDSNIAYPEFGFAVKKNSGETIQSLEIFYDLDYDGTKNESQNVYTENEKHFKIVMTDAQQAALIAKLGTVDSKGEPVPVVITKDDFPTLVTQQSFFDAYKPDGAAHGDYTYIVINVVVKDSSGKTKVVSERIKIKLTKDLLDLT